MHCIDLKHFILQSLISRLPAYLPIQFLRFFYKEKEAINAKILKVMAPIVCQQISNQFVGFVLQKSTQ